MAERSANDEACLHPVSIRAHLLGTKGLREQRIERSEHPKRRVFHELEDIGGERGCSELLSTQVTDE